MSSGRGISRQNLVLGAARRDSRYVRFKTVSVLRESVRSTFAVRKYSGFMYSANYRAVWTAWKHVCLCE